MIKKKFQIDTFFLTEPLWLARGAARDATLRPSDGGRGGPAEAAQAPEAGEGGSDAELQVGIFFMSSF